MSWSLSRCAASGTRCALQVLGALGIPQTLRRAIAHATLGLLLSGLRQDSFEPEAAARSFSALAKKTSTRLLSGSAHRIRTLAAVDSLLSNSHTDLGSIRALLETTMGLEFARLHSPTTPPRVELLAMGLRHFDSDWMRIIIQTEGAVPCGSRVALADGREGVVIGPAQGASPWKPLVLVGREVVQPQQDVSLISA